MTNQKLLKYHHQIRTWQKREMVEELFNSGKINDFYKEYQIRIETLNGDIEKLNNKYFVKDEHGIIKVEGEKGQEKPVYKEGMTQELFNAEYERFMGSELGTFNVNVTESNG